MDRPIEDLLTGMKSGKPQPDADIAAFIQGVVSGTVTRPQVAAWLAWAWTRTLTHDETVALTRAMTESGDKLTWAKGSELIDKHSTGGVGDKVSLVLAPLWVALGKRVPMISGRGLGHTGGTLDKLEAIPGYRCDLDLRALRHALDTVGCFISGQTGELAPADRVLYAVRDEVQAVDSQPLMVASILCKKLAEGLDRLVLDVKCGAGAFAPTPALARSLARTLVDVATGYGVACTALITDMDQPLGRAVGNANEVAEAVACLKGGGPDDLRELVIALADHPDAAATLASGRAVPVFQRMIEAQGGDPAVVDDPGRLLGGGVSDAVVTAAASGWVRRIDALAVGRAAFVLGAGRRQAGAPVDFGVGVTLHAKVGDEVPVGAPLYTLHHRDGYGLELARQVLTGRVELSDGPVARSALVHEVVEATR